MAPSSLDLVFAALADPTRRAILEGLSRGPKSVGDIAEPFSMTAPAITKHLKVLERAGLIKVDRKAQWRPRTLQAQPLKEAQDWLLHYRQFWEGSFDRLEAYIQQVTDQESST